MVVIAALGNRVPTNAPRDTASHPPAAGASPDETTILTDVEDNRAGTLQ